MAQLFNGFTQYTVGTFPGDWSAYTEVSGGGAGDTRHVQVVDLATEGFGAGTGLKFAAGSQTGNYLRCYLWSAVSAGSDLEIAYRFLCTTPTLCEIQGLIRADLSSQTWYQGGPRSGDDLDLNKRVNNSFTNLANNTTQDWINQGVWQWCRFRVDGTNLYVKVWNDGDTEPAEWDVEDEDSDIESGGVGFTTFRDKVFYVADFGVGTNGDPAPTGPVDPGTSDDLLADDLQSTTETGTPSIAQTHNLTSAGAESGTSVSSPTITQTHALTADDVESSSELTQPSLDSASTVDSLNAEDISSASETDSPAIGQTHNLAANDSESDSETGTPTIQQTHDLTSVSISSLSTVSSPSLTEIAGTDALSANDIESQGETDTPALSQIHALHPDNVQSGSEIPSPVIGQIHAITATGVSSASEVTSPVLRDASQVLKTPIRNTKATVVQTTYKAAIIQPVYKAEAG